MELPTYTIPNTPSTVASCGVNMKKLITLTVLLSGITLSGITLADIPKYYGYDWIDPYPTTAMTTFDKVKDHTNLNVVHSFTSLNSEACNNGKCVLNVSAGQSDVYVDICPNKQSDIECIKTSYQNIWSIVSKIKAAGNKPTAIYLIDEPFYEAALKNNNVYEPYRYSSYVCTFNEAMSAYGLSIPLFTVLADNQYKNPVFRSEILNGIPSTGCSVGIKSTLDWVGIDNYTWTTKQQVLDAYNTLDPQKKFKWVAVPASTYDVSTESAMTSMYKEFAEIGNNFIYIMNFRYDSRVGNGNLSNALKGFGQYIKYLSKP